MKLLARIGRNVNLAHEASSALYGSATKFKGQNQFRVALDANKDPRIADLSEVLFVAAPVSAFLADERPDFVALNVLYQDVPQFGCEQRFATFPGKLYEPQDCVSAQPSDAVSDPEAVSFDDQLQRQERLGIVNLLVADHSELAFRRCKSSPH